MRHRLYQDISKTFAVNIVSLLAGIAAATLAARTLGPSGRGQFAAVQNWLMLAVGLGSLGIPTASAYFAGSKRAPVGQVVPTAVAVLFPLSILTAAVMYGLFGYGLPTEDDELLRCARRCLLFIPLQMVGNLPFYVLQGLDRLGVWNAIRIQFPVLWCVFNLYAYLTHRTHASFITYGYVALMAVHCATWCVALALTVPLSLKPDPALFKPLFQYGTPTVLTMLPQQMNLKLDQLVMAAFLKPATLGLYVVAVSWGGILVTMLSPLAQVLFAKSASRGNSTDHSALRRCVQFGVLAAAGGSIVLVTITPVALPFFFGEAFRPAVVTAQILVLASAISQVSNIIGEGLKGYGRPGSQLRAQVMGLLCTVVLLPFLLPRYGTLGAALTSVVSYSVTACVLFQHVRRVTALPAMQFLCPDKRLVMGVVREMKTLLTATRV